MYLSMNDLGIIIIAMEQVVAKSNEEQETLNRLHEEYADYAKGKFVSLDPDQQVHYLNVLANYHSRLIEQEDHTDTLYMLGNIEGRMIHNHTMPSDLEFIEEWEDAE